MISELLPADPELVGPYRLLGRLGAGGMGQVYVARSPGGRLVAVKVIRPELGGDQEFRARFAREVSTARNVSGMFTALVVDADIEGPVPWLATVYVPGPSLAQAVNEGGPMPVDSLRALAAGLAEGLQAIHAAGVVHRDLKPSNVLLARDGPRVIDFGISRAVEGSVLTQSGAVMGSPGYLSPEQARGHQVGPPSDVFSLGAVLKFAATGQEPFGTGPGAALLYRVVREEPDMSDVPGEVRPLIAHCLAKDPGMRPSPGELLGELGTGEVASSWLPESIAGTFDRYERTAQLIAAATAAADSLQPEGPPTTSPVPQPRQPSQPVQSARPRPGRRRRLVGYAAAAVAVVAAVAVAAVLALQTPPSRHLSASGPTPVLVANPTSSLSPKRPHTAPATPAAQPTPSSVNLVSPTDTEITVAPRASQTITVSSTAPGSPQAGSTYSPAATASSGLPVDISVASTSSSVCSIGASAIVTFTAAGTCTVDFNQSGNEHYSAARQVTQTITVVPATTLCSTTNGSPTIVLYPATVSGQTATVNGLVVVTPGSTLTGIDWNWGDGTTATGCVYFPESHTYAQAGQYTVTVTATGTNGFQLQTSEKVSVP